MAEQDIVERLLDPDYRGPMQMLRSWEELDRLHDAVVAELKYESERGDEWFNAATYEVGGCPQLWSDRAKKAEAENASLRQQFATARKTARREALEEAALHAECHSDDRPGRDRNFDWNDGYIDGCRGAAEAIRALSHPDREGERNG